MQIPHAVLARGKVLLFLLYFGSGFCSLCYEVVFVRLLKLTLGNTVYASSVVISVFMAGLALGSFLMAPLSDRIKKPLRLYALLEAAVAAFAFVLPWLLNRADGVDRLILAGQEPSAVVLLIIQIAISALILLVPTVIMGSTLPLLGRYVASLQRNAGQLVGRLYAVNMFGATLGCLLTGFVLIKTFGIPETIYLSVAINVLVAAGGWLLSRGHDVSGAQATNIPPRPASDGNARDPVLLVAIVVSGMVSIGYEIIWMRSIVFVLSGYTYVFSAVLTMYLLGNVIGVGIGDFLLKKIRNPFFGFGVSLSLLGVAGICYIPVLSLWDHVLGPQVYPFLLNLFHTDRIGYGRVLPLIHSAVLFIIPSIAMGIGFPLSLQAWNSSRSTIGKSTGTVYGANTIGAIAGGVMAGFVLIPFLGVQKSMTLLGLLAAWVGGGVIQVFMNKQRASARRAAWLAATLGITIGAMVIPAAIFTKTFVFHYPGVKLRAVVEGVTTTASVHEEESTGELFLASSNLRVAGENRELFRIGQKMLGHLGLLLNQHARRVLSVGFGSGETTRCMSLHSNVKKIECVELSRELVRLSLRFFDRLNLGERLDHTVTMHYRDAKNFVHLSPSRYDLIVNDCINPKLYADNASLYTIEYFRDALGRLSPNGLFATYLPVIEMPFSCTNSILKSMAAVFPYITVWQPVSAPSWYNFWYIVGSREPQSFSPASIDRQLEDDSLRQSCRYVNFLNSHYALGCYVGDQDDLKGYLQAHRDIPVNSDMRPWVEFTTDQIGTAAEKMEWLAGFYSFMQHENGGGVLKYLDWSGTQPGDSAQWTKDHERFQMAAEIILKTQTTASVAGLFRLARSLALCLPEGQTTDNHADIICNLLKSNIFGGNAGAIESVTDNLLANEMPDFWLVWLARSWVMQEKNNVDEAVYSARKAFALDSNRLAARDQLAALMAQIGGRDSVVSR